MSKTPKPVTSRPVPPDEKGAGADTTRVDEAVHASSSDPNRLDTTLQPAAGVNMGDAPKSTLIAQPIASAKPEDPAAAVPGDTLVMINAPHAFRLLMNSTGPSGNPVPKRVQFKKGPQWCCRTLLDQKYVQQNGVTEIPQPAAPSAQQQPQGGEQQSGGGDSANPNANPVT